MTKNNYRHGDVALIGIDSLPEGLTASDTKVLVGNGSGGHTHSFSGGIFYPKVEGDFTVGYLKADGTKLYHPEHGDTTGSSGVKECSIQDGIYEVRRQVEVTHEGMKQVID